MRTRSLAIAALIPLVVSASLAVASELLPSTPPPGFTLQQVNPQVIATNKVKINEYTEAKTSHSWDVVCPQNNVTFGTVEFQYAPFKGDFDGGNDKDFMGAIINGGFKKTKDPCELIPGTTFRWLQHIIVDSDKNEHDDDKIDGSPLYPNFTMAGFTATLFDAPGRGTPFYDETLSWLAESALVCVNGKNISLIGSFLWGFDIVTKDGNTTVEGDPPSLWSSYVTSSLKSQFQSEYGGAGWTIKQGCCCVPTPGALALLLVGVVMVGGLRVRRAAEARRRRR
ncbi:MAG: hypothetical protein HQ592_15275 [Planctomycetes bacterium]|nr:hypothetical protein [Planctomycetota bacterium]